MGESAATGLLVECRDEPGVLYRITEAIFRHGANISYVAGGARRETIAELQLEISGAPDQSRLIADLEAVSGVMHVGVVPTFQMIYGKRVIVIGGGAEVGMVAQGAISEAHRYNIRGERISLDTIPLAVEEGPTASRTWCGVVRIGWVASKPIQPRPGTHASAQACDAVAARSPGVWM